jgi:hypothetical protein
MTEMPTVFSRNVLLFEIIIFISLFNPHSHSLQQMIAQRYLLLFLGLIVAVVIVFEAMQLSQTTTHSSVDSHLQSSLHALHVKIEHMTNSSAALERELQALREQLLFVKGGGSVAALRAALASSSSSSSSSGAAAPAAGVALSTSNQRRFHFVFSADCRYPPRVHWQSVVLLYSFFNTQSEDSVITEVLSCHKLDWKPHWHDYWTPEEKQRVKVRARASGFSFS